MLSIYIAVFPPATAASLNQDPRPRTAQNDAPRSCAAIGAALAGAAALLLAPSANAQTLASSASPTSASPTSATLTTRTHSAPPPSDPRDPNAPVPITPYNSVFANTPRGVEADVTPWRSANDDVGKFLRGHIDILKWEAQEASRLASPGEKAATPAPTPPAVVPAKSPSTTAAPHKH